MKINWLNNNNNSAVTIYYNNITLSKKAAVYFEDAYGVAVGIDNDSKNIILKKITKEEYNSNENDNLYKIDMKSSYARINSKPLVNELCNLYNFDFKKDTAYKFNAKWNTGYKMLIVLTEGGN